MREYKIAKGWAIFIYITAPLLIALFGYLLIMPFIPGAKNSMSQNAYWFLLPLAIGMIALMVVGLIDTVKGKFVIDNDKVYSVSTFSNRQFMFAEIKGYRVTDKHIFIEPSIDGKKKIKISTYLGNTGEIVNWLSSRYPNLDVLDAKQEEQEILSNEEFGQTVEEREEKLIKARKAAKILNWIGGLVCAWTLIHPYPYEYAIIASIAVPIMSIVVLKVFGGIIRIDEKKDSVHPTIFLAIAVSSSGICLRALRDYHVSDYSNFWKPAILIAAVFLALLFTGNKQFKFKQAKDIVTILSILLFVVGYAYGSVITLNCMYDKSEPEIFNAKILSKRISSGKTTTYYFKLTPWGQQKEIDEVSVSQELYKKLDKDSEVNIYFKKGQFKIPWFIVTE